MSTIGNTGRGLRQLRSDNGPVDPNKYHGYTPRKKCGTCGKKIRGENHAKNCRSRTVKD